MMNRNGKISILGFCLGLVGCISTYIMEFLDVKFGQNGIKPLYENLIIVIMFGFFILVVLLVLAKSNSRGPGRRETPKRSYGQDDVLGVISRSSFLGWIFSIGVVLVKHNKLWNSPFGIYLCFLTFFHYSEYLTTSLTSPSTLSTDSFLLNHSKAYGIAALGSWIEFGLEMYFFPSIKANHWVTIIGVVICLIGEIMRKLAMLTAMENFTHIIRSEKVQGHKLVTHGVFKLCRHPSYAGWFWWSIGTQVILVNPICIVGYAVASWNFFCYRITYEEATLYSFFGDAYKQYQDRVPRTGVPLVTGYRIKNGKIQ